MPKKHLMDVCKKRPVSDDTLNLLAILIVCVFTSVISLRSLGL